MKLHNLCCLLMDNKYGDTYSTTSINLNREGGSRYSSRMLWGSGLLVFFRISVAISSNRRSWSDKFNVLISDRI